jgi:hypothetical protein
MVVIPSEPDLFDEGYPRSSEADLDPGPDPSQSLEEADVVASDEHRVTLEHQRHNRPTDDADRFEDADSAGDAESMP